MNPVLYNAGKGFAVLTGLTLFVHSRFASTTIQTYMNPHPIFKNHDGYFVDKTDNIYEFEMDYPEFNEQPFKNEEK